MKKRILKVSISMLLIIVLFLAWKGFLFFNPFWNFAKIAQPIYTEVNDASPYIKNENIEIISKTEREISISDVVYFTNPNQVHMMVVYKKPRQRYHLRAVMLTDTDRVENFTISGFGENQFLLWNSYRIIFDQIDLKEDQTYIIQIQNELDDEKMQDLGQIKFKFKKE